MIDPVAEYDTHTEGHSVIGGFVYRGTEIEQLAGRYVFGDFAKRIDFGRGLFTKGRLFFLNKKDVVRNGIKESKVVELRLLDQDGDTIEVAGSKNKLPLAVLGFGQDSTGELYVLANETGVPFEVGDQLAEPTGVVLKITPAAGH